MKMTQSLHQAICVTDNYYIIVLWVDSVARKVSTPKQPTKLLR
jgi:hypothetical protein